MILNLLAADGWLLTSVIVRIKLLNGKFKECKIIAKCSAVFDVCCRPFNALPSHCSKNTFSLAIHILVVFSK